MQHALCETSLGWVAIGIDRGAICATTLPGTKTSAQQTIVGWHATEAAPAAVARPLVDLVRRAVEGKPVQVNGRVRITTGTPFQRAVWKALLTIPRGATVSYADVARRIGRPLAARAVGQAVGHNPVPLLIPCHRVLASGGGIGGFGGGVRMKRALLRNEGVA
jgi:methylated-DNA-[protein]-cysteine S-methyltransferase